MTTARALLVLLCSSRAAALTGKPLLRAKESVRSVQGAVPPTGMTLVSRTYVPYGAAPTARAFGMGACEQIAYDPEQKYAYAASEQGYVNVIDFNNAAAPTVTAFGIDFTGQTLTDVEVCGCMLFVSMAGTPKTAPGSVKIYDTVKRAMPAAPTLKSQVIVGALPDMIRPNHGCSALAVANEGEGEYSESPGSLVDPVGSVSIITDLMAAVPTVRTVDFGSLCSDDDDCISKGVHLPLPKKAMEYFDDHSSKFKDDLNFGSARAAYTTATQFEPEYVVWSSDDSTIYASLQENSAIVTINACTGMATSIHPYGLKDWSASGTTGGIDTVKDSACTLAFKPGFETMRMPDSIAAFEINGVTYIATADEGADKEYGAFEEKQKFKDVVDSATTFDNDFAEFQVGPGMADAYANFGDTKMRITIGSSAVDYSTPATPVFKGAVGFGGRGISIFRASDMSLLWDSGSDLEREQCSAYPWAHNGIQDEEFSPLLPPGNDLYASLDPTSDLAEAIADMNDPNEDGCLNGGDTNPGACPLGETVDERSLKNGAAPESVVVGYACGRMLLVAATEKQGTAFVYDVSDPAAPAFLFVKHLSPDSRTKNPGVAYADGTLGDIDAESILFLDAGASPTGRAGVMFGGVWSGTISLYEFDGCVEPAKPPTWWWLKLARGGRPRHRGPLAGV